MVYFCAMMRLLKTWLLLMLMTLLPLQAVAAGMRLSCANELQGTRHSLSTDAGAPACHQAQATPKMDGTDSTDSAPGERHAVCGACSASCMGACMSPPSAPALAASDGAQSVPLTDTPPLAGFVPDGPRRPPRPA